jgi:Concanavalin A-like lectin/glucanases superfamily
MTTTCLRLSAQEQLVLAGWTSMDPLADRDFTIEFWVRPDTPGFLVAGGDLMVMNNLPYVIGFYLELAADCTMSVVLRDFNGNIESARSATNPLLFDGAWHHVALARQAGTATVYVDGLGLATATNPFPIDTKTAYNSYFVGGPGVHVGAPGVNGTLPAANGLYNEVRGWTLGMSQAQVQYAMWHPWPFADPMFPSNLPELIFAGYRLNGDLASVVTNGGSTSVENGTGPPEFPALPCPMLTRTATDG